VTAFNSRTRADPAMTRPEASTPLCSQGMDEEGMNSLDLLIALNGFRPVALSEMAHAALMDRCESKFLLPATSLPRLLTALSAQYQVLTMEGQTLLPYRSLYLDTPGFDFYYAHHNGRARRYKVRFRSYEQTQTTFLEVKERHPSGRTVKTRASVEQPQFPLSQLGTALVEGVPTHDQALEPKLWVNYNRITLVGIGRPERVTLDLGLEFQLPGDGSAPGAAARAENLVIVELKRATARQASPLEDYARAQGFRSGGFSKYGVGCSLLYPVRHNAFKPQRLAMQRLAVQCTAMQRLEWSA
jgi:VTC domain